MTSKAKPDPHSGFSLREAMHLQMLEDNPLDPEQVAMFAIFDREGLTTEQRRAHLEKYIRGRAARPAAE